MAPTDLANPLLLGGFRIPFHRIEAGHVVPAVDELMRRGEEEIEAVAGTDGPPTWANTIERLDAATRQVREGTTPVQHLLSVAETPELRAAWSEVLPRISSFWTRLHLHESLWARLKAFAETDEAASLTGVARRHLRKTLREFRRSGADLPEDDRARLEELEVELAQLEQRFSENVLDATADWRLHVTDEDELRGIPADALQRFRRRAREEGEEEGWILTLDAPSVQAVLKHARSRGLRQRVHGAYMARGRREPWDNRPLIPRILEIRQEKAKLLGYPNFPDYRLEEQMARSGQGAWEFVEGMVERTRPYRERDLDILNEAAEARGIGPLRPWDVAFLIEELRRERFELDEEELRPYFPLDRVLHGMFELTHRLFGLRVRERDLEDIWHEDVRYFE
ncbi:MAG: M3 family metallopeptidase, partial [bacterium]